MANSKSSARVQDSRSTSLSCIEKSELKSIKVAITRRNISEPYSLGPLLRNLDDPFELQVHFRLDGWHHSREKQEIRQEKKEERITSG